MVHRPPPKQDPSAASTTSSTHRTATAGVPRRGLEWSLRSMHKIDTSAQHFLTSYYGEDSDEEYINGLEPVNEPLEDQTAFAIFKGKEDLGNDSGRQGNSSRRGSVWEALHAPLRTGVVDGKKVVFELLSNVTQPPLTSRQERLQRKLKIIKSDRSSPEVRLRFWLMHFSVSTVTALFLAVFVVVNVVFAGFFYAVRDRCCGDSSMSFGEVFAFTVQTSTTIGYGSFSPTGTVSNFLVVILSYVSTLMNTLFAGLLFTKFVTPVINVQFSEVMTLCNVNGVPCLSVRLGNADGYSNRLTDINVRLSYSYQIPYQDHKGEQKLFQQTDDLKLLSTRRFGLREVWTLRHVLDENSPLFGLHFDEHPANKIYVFTLSVDAVQDLTKSSVNVQTEYAVEDILIGRAFVNQVTFEDDGRVARFDYSKMSDTEPYPVWYPAKTGTYDTKDETVVKEFKP